MKLVSVIIPCYNHERFLSQTIESILNQTYSCHEIIVVDDGSTDNSGEVAAQYPGVQYIRQSNQGRSAACNTGIAASKGEYLVFLDADDYLKPEALATNLQWLDANPSWEFVAGLHQFVDMNRNEITGPGTIVPAENHYKHLLEFNYIFNPGTVMYRKQLFTKIAGFDTHLKHCEDYEMYLRVARQFPIGCHDTIVAEYRIHPGNKSKNAPGMLKTVLKLLSSQRQFVVANKEENELLNKGIASFKQNYGGQTKVLISERIAAGKYREGLLMFCTLIRCCPEEMVRVLIRKLTR